MRKLLILGLLVLPSLAIGGVGGYAISQYQKNATRPATDTKQASQKDQQSAPRAADKVSGFNMTPPDMADELDAMPAGEDIGWRYATYVIQIRNYEVAMARAAREKATQPEVKQIAQDQIDANQSLIDKLYVLMKASGMSH